MKEQNTYKRRQGMSIVFSVVLHLVLLVLVIAASAMPVKEKPKVLKVQLASLKKPEPLPVQEPPKPEPPKPELPKPEPPKPEPPKPEPPKQVAKPDPPKPPEPKPVPKPEVKPLPTPKPVEKNPPKPPDTKKQPEKPKQDTPKPKSLAERLAEGRTQTQPVQQQPRKSGNDIAKRLKESLNQPQATILPNSSDKNESTAIEVETRSYAEEIVRPYIQRNWREPTKGELEVRNPSPVEVSFTVYANGNVHNARIVKMSNSRVLNSSVQEFLRNMTRLSPLSAIGSNSSSLKIEVTMNVAN